MSETITELEARMAAAAQAQDYEEASRLRDRIARLRDPAAGLVRQQPGSMGLGTSRQRTEPPPGWTPPKKPDPMTKGRKR